MEFPSCGGGGSALVPPLADRCLQLRRDAPTSLTAAADQCRTAADDWTWLTERLDVLEAWLDEQPAAEERYQDAADVDDQVRSSSEVET